MPLKPEKCSCCNEIIGKDFSGHKSSPTHLFNYYLWCYINKKKSLAKDKDGIRLDVIWIDDKELGLNLNYNRNRGKYTIEVKPNQLQLNNNNLKFRCCLYNDRKEDDIFLTAARTLDASVYSWCNDDKENWQDTDRYIKIKPKEWYNGVVINFQVENVIIGSYKIPFALNLQTEDGKTDITLCRTIIVKIADYKEEEENVEKSPFTDKSWEKEVNIIRPIKKKKFVENYPFPLKFSKHFKFGFREWKGIEIAEYEDLVELRSQMEPGYITKENYQKYFHNCLWLEEVVVKTMLRRYNMENVNMSFHSGEILRLQVPGLAEKRPSLIAGDLILVRIHEDHTAYQGYIKDVEDKHINIEFMDPEVLEMIEKHPNTEMDVAFNLGRLSLERAHEAVDRVCAKGFLVNLFPDSLHFDPYFQVYELKDKDFFNDNVVSNLEQRTAVEKILNCSSHGAPYIVFGPPGTGKTVTIVEAICQILKKTKKRILICAPANAACDMLTSKLIPYCNKNQLKRIHSDSRDITSITKDVQEYSNINKGTFSLITWKDLMKYRIVVSTLVLIGKFSNDGYHPNFVFIDEAAQATEAEACIAISTLKQGGSIVLAGDPMQLGPSVNSTIAQDYGFHKSLLERLMDTQKIYADEDPNFITMLKKNFRSHPEILNLPNEMFYDSKLEARSQKPKNDPISKINVYLYESKEGGKSKKKSRKNKIGHAIEFCAVSAKERREGRSPSYFNPAEANMVIKYIKTLMDLALPPEFKVKPSDIGVITPYVRQVYKIKGLLKFNNIEDVEVGSTEAFQGREKRIIIISTVRAQYDLLKYDRQYALGFVKQEKRFNVALTRAISKLIVIGCPLVLATDNKWSKFIEECIAIKTYHGSKFEKRTNDKVAEIIERFRCFPKISDT